MDLRLIEDGSCEQRVYCSICRNNMRSCGHFQDPNCCLFVCLKAAKIVHSVFDDLKEIEYVCKSGTALTVEVI